MPRPPFPLGTYGKIKAWQEGNAWLARASSPTTTGSPSTLDAYRTIYQRHVKPALGGWRDPSNVRRVWRQVRDEAQMNGLASHMLRKTVASFLDDADVPTARSATSLGTPRSA